MKFAWNIKNLKLKEITVNVVLGSKTFTKLLSNHFYQNKFFLTFLMKKIRFLKGLISFDKIWN